MMFSSVIKVIALSGFLSLSTAATVYEGATIISFNETTERLSILHNASLLVEDGTISSVQEGRLPSVPQNATHINATDKIIGPGYIDTHHHLWQTAFKTLGSNTTLAEYFQRYGEYGPAVQHFTPEDVYIGQLAGTLELLYEGTTTVIDHAHASWSDATIDAGLNGTLDGGIRAVFANTIHPLSNDYTWDDQISKFRSLTTDARLAESSLVELGLGYDHFYHAAESNTTTLWDIAKSANISAVTSHFLGGPWGFVNSPQKLAELGWLNDTIPIIFSHASFLNYLDASALRETNQYISTTPESEWHFGHGHPWAEDIQDQAALGVDCHFTYSSSMVNQARMWLQNLRHQRFREPLEHWHIPSTSPMSVEQAYYLITRAGAKALRREDIGVIKPGAKADLLVYGTESPNMLGYLDPVAAIILHSSVADIEDVMVDGKFVKRGGKLVRNDYASVRQRLLASAKRIQGIWEDMHFAALEGNFDVGSGAPYGTPTTIDTLSGPGTGY